MAARNQNDDLVDAQLLAAILALGRSEKLAREAIALLNESERDIAALIRRTKTGLATPADFRRMQALIADIKKTRAAAWRRVETLMRREMTTLAKQQPKRMQKILADVGEDSDVPTDALLESIATKREFGGADTGQRGQARTLALWLAFQRDNDAARIAAQVRFGLIRREPPDRIARRVLGEGRLMGANGATEEARRRLFELAVLAGLFAANESKREFAWLNRERFDREIYLAILDARTTDLCRSLNKRVFRVGEGPYPPLHFWCRSIRVFLLPGAKPADITDLATWIAAQSEDVRRLIEEARGQRFQRS